MAVNMVFCFLLNVISLVLSCLLFNNLNLAASCGFYFDRRDDARREAYDGFYTVKDIDG